MLSRSATDDVSTVVDDRLVVFELILTDRKAVHHVCMTASRLSQVLKLAQCVGVRPLLYHIQSDSENSSSTVVVVIVVVAVVVRAT